MHEEPQWGRFGAPSVQKYSDSLSYSYLANACVQLGHTSALTTYPVGNLLIDSLSLPFRSQSRLCVKVDLLAPIPVDIANMRGVAS